MTKKPQKSRNGGQYRGDKPAKSGNRAAPAKNRHGGDDQRGKNFKDNSRGRDDNRSSGKPSGNKPSGARNHPSGGLPEQRSAVRPSSGASPSSSIGAGGRPNLFGTHAVREAWLNPERDIKALYITAEALQGFSATIEGAQRAGIQRPPATIVDKHMLGKMLQGEQVHQGVAVTASDVPEVFLSDIIISEQGRADSLILILDQVTDPHNVGAILRSASAFGAAAVIMQRKHAPELSGVLAKTACGAVDHIRTVYETNLSRAIESLQEAGYFVYGLDERGTENIMDIKRGGRVVLVLGAEGAGLRRLVAEHCDALLRLPTGGAIASLNVSNAAAVALYALIKH